MLAAAAGSTDPCHGGVNTVKPIYRIPLRSSVGGARVRCPIKVLTPTRALGCRNSVYWRMVRCPMLTSVRRRLAEDVDVSRSSAQADVQPAPSGSTPPEISDTMDGRALLRACFPSGVRTSDQVRAICPGLPGMGRPGGAFSSRGLHFELDHDGTTTRRPPPEHRTTAPSLCARWSRAFRRFPSRVVSAAPCAL
jgi:hypothetical protein